MEICTDSLDIKTECEVNLQQYLFRANTRTGYWEIELYTTGEITIPLNMQHRRKTLLVPVALFKKIVLKVTLDKLVPKQKRN